MSQDRPNPDQLLANVQAAEQKQARGKLKLFFGAAPGVGKTYSMLEAARKAAKEGADVLVGYVEPHARPETQALVLGLDVLERREVEYRGGKMYEFDLAGALARKPGLILVDELAHTNAQGSAHAKRWQDVIDLLDAGIDVYSTLNVQHLESLNDVVAQITGVAVRETVPDWVFEKADEIELVNLAPDDLLERLREGKVYVPEQAQRAITNFFQKGNLIALRELALRQSAQRVDAQMVEFRRENAINQTWPAAERLLVCVSSSPDSARLVRATRRMAASLRAPWIAVHVETPASLRMSDDDRQRLTRNLRLAEQLGGETAMISGASVVEAVIAYARNRNISKIMVGKPQQPRWRDLLRGPFVYELARRCGEIDVHIISGDQGIEAPRGISLSARKSSPWEYVWATLAVAVCTLISMGLDRTSISEGKIVNIVMVYLLGVVAVSLRCGRGPSMFTSLAGVIAFDFFFITPRLTFAVADTQYLFTFIVMFVTGTVISSLVARLAAHAELAQRGEQRTIALYGMSREFAAIQQRDAIVNVGTRHVAQAIEGQVCLLLPNSNKRLEVHVPQEIGFKPSEHDEGVARWVFDHRQPAGLGTDTLPGAEALYLPLATAHESIGVLGIRPARPAAPLDIDQSHLLEALAGLIALALERADLAQQAEQRRMQIETERLRNSLLSAVSHDLRTPLAAIAGASSTLLDADQSLPAETRRELVESIFDETNRLSRLVANLLDMTRLEGGGMAVKKEWQPIEEIVGVVIHRFGSYAAQHPIETQIAPQMPPVPFDDVLVQQVLVNLVENAMKHSPPQAPVTISAAATPGEVTISVSDRGLGIKPGEEQRLFEKFYRSNGSNGRSGVGLGLAICRGIVELHGGRIWAENNPRGGARFSFTLPIVGRPPAVPLETARG